MDYESTAHAKYLILYHLIFVCKYRKKLLIAYGQEMKQIFEEIAANSDFSFEVLEVDRDHLHCLVKSKPRLSPLAIVRRLKQESTFRLWKRHEQELRRHFWKELTFGAMATFVAQLAMPVRIPSVVTSNCRGEGGPFIHEAEDFAVFLPSFYKERLACTFYW